MSIEELNERAERTNYTIKRIYDMKKIKPIENGTAFVTENGAFLTFEDAQLDLLAAAFNSWPEKDRIAQSILENKDRIIAILLCEK